MGTMFGATLIWAWLFGLISAVIAGRRGLTGATWFLLGAALGPIGVIITCLANNLPRCQACGTKMLVKSAVVCPACGREVRQPSRQAPSQLYHG